MKKYCKNENVLVKLFFIQQGCTKLKKLLFYYIYYVYIKTHTCMYIFKKNMLRLYIKLVLSNN